MTRRRQIFAASATLAACLALAGCRAKEGAEQPAGNQEMKVEQTPVSSIYDEKGGVLYERPQKTPTVSNLPLPTPSPTDRGKG